MKPMHFDFSAKPVYLNTWALFAILVTCLLVALGWQMRQLTQESRNLDEQIKLIQTKLGKQQVRNPEPVQSTQSPAFSRQANQAAQLLQTDLNIAFAALENLKIPGVRLQSLTLNASQNLVEVEFDFKQLGQTSDISEALMSGYAKSPWQLMSANAQIYSMPQGASTGAAFTGRWQAKMDRL